MNKLLLLVLATFTGVVMSNEPVDAFTSLIDAFYEGDAACVENGLSSDSIEMINMMLMMIRMQPAQAAAELSEEFQIALTGPELMNWTSTDFIYAFINAPGIIEDLPAREDIEISGFDIQGDSSTVFLKVADYPDEFEVAMVREGNDWKLGDNLLQSEL